MEGRRSPGSLRDYHWQYALRSRSVSMPHQRCHCLPARAIDSRLPLLPESARPGSGTIAVTQGPLEWSKTAIV